MPEFSIIVPVYKTENYIEKCINSILSQTFDDFEVILVDDGSPDKSGEICDEYARKDKRVKVVHKENGGVSSARNSGIDVAEGKFIWFVDSDDYIEPFSLEEIDKAYKAKKADIYFFNTSNTREAFSGPLDNFLERYYFSYVVGFGPWNKLYRTEVIRKNALYFDVQETIGEDLLFNIAYYKAIYGEEKERRFIFMGRDYYIYVNREASAMNTVSKNRIVQQMRLFDKIEMLIRGKISDENMTYLFWLHLISGINQSAAGGLTSLEYADCIDFSKYGYWINGFKKIKKSFFENEKASLPGRARLDLFQFALDKCCPQVAGKIIGLK